jgi:hypothetical protein
MDYFHPGAALPVPASSFPRRPEANPAEQRDSNGSSTLPTTPWKVKVKGIGVLDGIGIRIVAGGFRDTVSATVFTDRFHLKGCPPLGYPLGYMLALDPVESLAATETLWENHLETYPCLSREEVEAVLLSYSMRYKFPR